jgi:hypothetical protein
MVGNGFRDSDASLERAASKLPETAEFVFPASCAGTGVVASAEVHLCVLIITWENPSVGFSVDRAAILDEWRRFGQILRVDKFQRCRQPDGVTNFRHQALP